MNCKKFLLSQENSFCVDNLSVEKRLKDKGVEALWSERSTAVDTVVVHFMSDCIENPERPYEFESLVKILIRYEVSAHYLILRDGEVIQLVPESEKAWHAGGSIMPEPDNRVGVNDFSIGIELAGGEQEPFTDEQYLSLNGLIVDIKSRNNITSIVGHEDISGERAVREGLRSDVKVDPGQKFDWTKLPKKSSL